jgi:hypothetical protein
VSGVAIVALVRRSCRGVAAAFLLVACSKGPDPESTNPAPTAASIDDACGATGEADCPLQGWMKATMTPAVTAADFARLERGFRRVADLAPPGYATWNTAALAGADAAARGDLEGARRACKACHDDSRPRYRRELRSRPLP